MNAKNLGRLRKVELREAWSSESSDFTPWLAREENLKLLGETIGIDLELVKQEKDVGPFRADILCKDTATDHWVLIENQLERTDHSHLGQLLTYAAGLNAVTIVWIAERFTDEHRAAMQWLNDKTEEGINFFALEVELWQIGDSPFAPKFNVISKPNEWTRSVADSAKNTEVSELRWNYWSEFVTQPELKPILAGPLQACRQGNLNLPTRWRDFKLTVYFSRTNKLTGVYVLCRGENGGENYRQLLAKKDELEKRLGAALKWQASDSDNRGWITLHVPKHDVLQADDWPRQHKQLATKAVEFYEVFDPFIQELDNTTAPEA